MSKRAITNGRDIRVYETRGRDNYRTGSYRTVVYDRLPSQAEVVNGITGGGGESGAVAEYDGVRPSLFRGPPKVSTALLQD
ncbi:hypothetical protein J6590_058273 [Homalodisca vitripennis]|nr:hypothetical protein J6590_058273 [Homalodisca vitripennis]